MRIGETEKLSEDLEERADQLLEAVMKFDDAKIENFYDEIRSGVNIRHKMRELADRAVAVCMAEQRKQPQSTYKTL